MKRNLTLGRPHGAIVTLAAAGSTLIAIGTLAAVTTLFEGRGAPMAQLAAGERACSGHIYVSDREACIREWVVAAKGNSVASR